jgi:hypothetical protein
VFDLLCLNGYALRKLPLIERKALLKKIIATQVFFFHGWWRPGDSKPPRCHPDCRRTRWIAAGKILATDPAALVPCPVCGDEKLLKARKNSNELCDAQSAIHGASFF